MFYPKLGRRSTYSSPHGKGGFFADYNKYAEEVAADCQHRCVYCDAKIQENMGGDSFQLDHFRPQKHFPALACDPNNLVLACPACNRLKWDHWPAGVVCSDPHFGGIGFVDPFVVDRLEYFEIEVTGKLSPKQSPAAYIIKLLHLDRPARIHLRRRRILSTQGLLLLDEISQRMRLEADAFENDEIDKCEYLKKLGDLKNYLASLNPSWKWSLINGSLWMNTYFCIMQFVDATLWVRERSVLMCRLRIRFLH